MNRKEERLKEIELVRANAREAFEAGRSIHSMPAKYRGNMDGIQWRGEYTRVSGQDQQREQERLEDKEDTRNRFIDWLMTQYPNWDD